MGVKADISQTYMNQAKARPYLPLYRLGHRDPDHGLVYSNPHLAGLIMVYSIPHLAG